MEKMDTAALDRLLESWNRLLASFPRKKRALLESVGEEMLEEVRSGIGGTGKVQGWQAPYQGSGGGYVAVRARAKTYQQTKSGKQYAVGYVTNAIEGGHRHGGPRGGGKGYKPRYKTAAVPGRHFYAQAKQALPQRAAGAVRDLTREITDGLEGRA